MFNTKCLKSSQKRFSTMENSQGKLDFNENYKKNEIILNTFEKQQY